MANAEQQQSAQSQALVSALMDGQPSPVTAAASYLPPTNATPLQLVDSLGATTPAGGLSPTGVTTATPNGVPYQPNQLLDPNKLSAGMSGAPGGLGLNPTIASSPAPSGTRGGGLFQTYVAKLRDWIGN